MQSLGLVGKLTEVYHSGWHWQTQAVHMKELTDFPENDQEDPTEVFTDFISGGDLSLMEPIICHMDPISEQVEIHL